MEQDTPETLFFGEARVVLIVVGARLRAEVGDRPLAYKLQKRIRRWLARHQQSLATTIEPVVCSDVWYLNSDELRARPTISIGGPGVDAFAALLAEDLDEDPGEEQQVLIQIDPDFTDLRASIWGSDHALTSKGLDVFCRQYLDDFLRAVATQIEPREE